MKRAIGVYVWLAENYAGDSTVHVTEGEGPLTPGEVHETAIEIDEEGIVSVGMPGIGTMSMTSLDTGDESGHRESFEMLDDAAGRIVKQIGNRAIELVRFGPEGREHIKWYGKGNS